MFGGGLVEGIKTPGQLVIRKRSHCHGARADAGNASDGKAGEYDYDLFTIGAGSGGVRASRFATQYGAKAAVCELPFSTISSDSTGGVGGTCVIRGCVPKKLMVYSSHYSHDFESSRGFGWSYPAAPMFEWATLRRNKNKELERLTKAYRTTLANANVDLLEGRGKVVGPHEVDVNGRRITARHILIAVGGRATVPDLPGREYVITSDEALDLEEVPRKICIVGGGYIALEFAGIFNGLGAEVHVFMRQAKPLRGFDEEVREFLAEQLTKAGIILHTSESPASVEKLGPGALALVTESGLRVEADTVMFATGRAANTKNLGLEEVGVKLDKKGTVEVDEYSHTSVPSIWAVGDCTNRINLTPVALMEGMAFAKTVFGGDSTKPDYSIVPSAVFTQPPIGTSGLTEEQAIEKYGDVDVYTSSFRPMKATLSGLEDRTFMKVIVDVESHKVVGVHMVGDDAAEILQGIAIAMKAGCTKEHFDSTVGIHPSAAEEFVSMRTPTRRIRRDDADKAKAPQPAASVSY
eukprot:jgi/Mesen1/9945/ME000071S09365